MTRSIALSVDLVHSALNCNGPLRTLDQATLQVLEQRYKRFLALADAHPEQRLAPTGDIDEMWHLHMLHPRAYHHDCVTLFGGIVDHHPDFANADAATREQLAAHFALTEALWERAYGEPYMLTELVARDAAGAHAAPSAGGAYCIESTARAHAAQPLDVGAAYCIESGAGKSPALGAAYCIESAGADAHARAVALSAAYCIKSSALKAAAAPAARGLSYSMKTPAATAAAPTVSLGAAYCIESSATARLGSRQLDAAIAS